MRAKDKRRKDGLNNIFRRGDHKQPDKRKPITFNSGGDGAGGKKGQLYMDSVGDNRGGNGNRKMRAQVSSYKPTKSVRPSGHYAPPGGKFSGKIRDRRGSWNDN